WRSPPAATTIKTATAANATTALTLRAAGTDVTSDLPAGTTILACHTRGTNHRGPGPAGLAEGGVVGGPDRARRVGAGQLPAIADGRLRIRSSNAATEALRVTRPAQSGAASPSLGLRRVRAGRAPRWGR